MIDRRTWLLIGLLGLLALVPVIALALDEPFYIGQFRRILIFAIAAVSLDLILGYGGMVSLGHAAFFGAGAYVVAILNWHANRRVPLFGLDLGTLEPLVTWTLASAVAAVLAAIIGLFSVRTSGIYFIMITLAFAQMVYFFFVSLQAYGGQDGLRFRGATTLMGLSTRDTVTFYYIILAALIVIVFGVRQIVGSRFGMVLQGCRDNERRLAALGYPIFPYKLAAFTLAGAICGFAGALFATDQSFVSPELIHWTRSGDLIVMVVLGGMGTLAGPIAGATVFMLLEKFLPDYTEHWKIIFGPVLLLIVLYAKHGLWGLIDRHAGRHGNH